MVTAHPKDDEQRQGAPVRLRTRQQRNHHQFFFISPSRNVSLVAFSSLCFNQHSIVTLMSMPTVKLEGPGTSVLKEGVGPIGSVLAKAAWCKTVA